MCDAVVIRITPDNLDERIEKAVHTIVSCWDDWDGSAQQDEQREQDPQAWYDTIEAQLRCVLLGMVIDDEIRQQEPPKEKPGTWPQVCVQRAFVEGAQWWQFFEHGSTMFGSERDEAEAEAVRRYGDPCPVSAG